MWNTEDSAKNSDAQLQWARSLTQNLKLQDYQSILDVGCGDGKIIADFAKFPQSRVVGTDSSPDMIAYASQKYPASQYPLLTFECMNARTIASIKNLT